MCGGDFKEGATPREAEVGWGPRNSKQQSQEQGAVCIRLIAFVCHLYLYGFFVFVW